MDSKITEELQLDNNTQVDLQKIQHFLQNIDCQSSVKKYEFEWREISQFLLSNNLTGLRKHAIKGYLKTSKFRSICWSLFFGLLNPEDTKQWGIERNEQRKRYKYLKEKFCLNPHSVEDRNDDPLSQSDKSMWNQHFCDQELCAVIKQDVVRTFPGIDFFRKSFIQEIMISVLFCYAREKPKMCYRQGMHEILAPVLFVIHSDHQAFLHFQQLNSNFDPILTDLLDESNLEEDSFLLFSHIMSIIESYYRINDLIPTSTGYFPSSPNMPMTPDEIESTTHINEIEISDQLNLIRNQVLAKYDFNLNNHLLQLDIPLAIFGIRWLRLLFGREFPLQDLLILWDAIFAEDNSFSLTNYIVVSMLVSIREKLLASDYTSCLTLLMKYPNTVDISHIINLALYIKSPDKYQNPNVVIRNEKYATLPKHLVPRHSIAHPTPINNLIKQNTRRASAHGEILGASFHEKKASTARINGIHAITARTAIRVAAQNHNIGEPDLGIVDGYLENDPEVSILTLQHAQSIMAISRFKLIQYLAVIRKNLNDSNENICNALDGIEEICSLLKNTYSTPLELKQQNIPVPVDPAVEANEAGMSTKKEKSSNKKVPLRNINIDLNPKTNHQIGVLKSNEDSKKNINKQINFQIHKKTNLQRKESIYEIPDNSRIATHLFGNAREIQMSVLSSTTSPECRLSFNNYNSSMPLVDPTLERAKSLDGDN